MVARGVGNFPLLILALYPAFLGLPETRQLLRSLARPTITRVAGSLLLAGGGLAALSVMPKRWLYRSPWVHPLAPAVNDVFLWAAFVLLGYVALTLASMLIDRRAFVAPDASEAAGESPARGPRAGLEPARRLAAVVVLLVVSAFAWINVADLIGLPSAGGLFMFSGLSADRSNHLVVPRLGTRAGSPYVSIVRFDPQDVTTREAQDFAAFSRWLSRPGQERRVSLNFLRYHLARICRSAPGARVRLELRATAVHTRAFDDVCREPAMLRYWTVLTPAPCHPRCGPALRRWAKGEAL
jgi:hypothetical protein